MALSSSQLSEAYSVATQYINDSVPDILETSNPIYRIMVQENSKFVDGGIFIQFPIAAYENLSQGFIAADGSQAISLNTNQILTYGQINWKTHYTNLSITLDDMIKTQNTPLAIKSLLMAKTAQVTASMAREISSAFYSSSASLPNQFDGLLDVCGPSGTAYANINNTDIANWLALLDSSSQIINYANINKNVMQLSVRTGQSPSNPENNKKMLVDTMLSNYYVMSQYMASEQIKQRYISETQLKSGFDGIQFNGKINWVADGYAPGSADGTTADNTLFILTSNTFNFFYKYGLNGKKSPLASQGVIPNLPVQYNVDYLSGNLGCINRRLNCYMSTLKA